ncbi:methyltransferase [Altererythrobacter salegens]|uniref:Methyltransferase n=1 Tax=Croceibacterium salegens TaxID=1737568 RepID=A0A6I4SUC8_9SPHN|nr:methyltransferase [Croceibacterium salegens]MXO59704.1 methyltransferase [Croceibacterium salegens]
MLKSAPAALAAALLVSTACMAAAASPDVTAIVADPARPEADRALDASRHPAELLALLDLKEGQTVADIWPGDYWDRLFADAVGPTGKVYAAHLTEADAAEKQVTPPPGSMPIPEHPNVTSVSTTANTFSLPSKADVIWFRQNYHDLYDKFMGPSDVPAFNKAVYEALKPGGRFVIIDHTGKPGSSVEAMEKLHRIDPAVVKQDLAAAGFRLVAESDTLRNPDDALDLMVFNPAIRGKTDQFVYVFERP